MEPSPFPASPRQKTLLFGGDDIKLLQSRLRSHLPKNHALKQLKNKGELAKNIRLDSACQAVSENIYASHAIVFHPGTHDALQLEEDPYRLIAAVRQFSRRLLCPGLPLPRSRA